ncbi:MAG: MATE family efflux transporter [Ignavibacteria bacterium]|nr:MATE family efflux transporter [Ignavibacteria bacterium]
MTIKEHLKETVSLALPVVIAQVGFVMMGVVDSAMVGRLGDAPLAASSLSLSLFFIITVIGLGIVMAMTPLVAIAVGSSDSDKCSRVFHQGIWVSLFSGIILNIVVYFGTDIISYMDQPKEVVDLALSYTRIISFSIPPMLLFTGYKQFIEGLSFTRPAMVISIAANVVNFFFNWIFIYGNWGAPALGLDGAGYATLGSRIFMFVSLAVFVHKNREFKRFGLKIFPFKGLDENGKEILRIGIPSGIQYFFEVGCFATAAFMVGWIGKDELASHQIALNVASLTYLVCLGLSTAGTIRVGNAVGAKNITQVRKAATVALFLGASFMVCAGILLIIFKEHIPLLYASDPEVVSIAPKLLMIAAFFQIFDGTQAIALGNLRGITDVKIPTVITFIAYWLIGLPGAYIFGFPLGLGTEGIWYGLSLSLIASSLMLNIRFFVKTGNPNMFREKIAEK